MGSLGIYYTKKGKFEIYDRYKIPHSKLHRLNGPALIWNGGDKVWYKNGEIHREDGPAVIESNGDKEWWVNDKQHRLDGPAVTWKDGFKIWYINDKELNKDEVENWIRNNNINLKTKKGQSLFMLKFG